MQASGQTKVLDIDRYFSSNVFVHTHLEKAAGTTFNSGVGQIVGMDRLHRLESGLPPPIELSDVERQNIRLLSGHFYFNTKERPLGKKRRYFMTMRHPVPRFISFYKFVVWQTTHPNHGDFGKLDAMAAYEFLKRNQPGTIYNKLCRILLQAGRLPRAQPKAPRHGDQAPVGFTFAEARKIVDEHYALVIPISGVDAAIRRIAEVFGRESRRMTVEKKKVGPTRDIVLPDAIIREIERENEEDLKLMAYCEANFERHLAELGDRLSP